MKSYVFLNDSFVAENEAAIPISDRGFLFGDGAFTTIRVSDGIVEFAREHLEALHRQCGFLGIDLPMVSLAKLSELVAINRAHHGIWRLKIIVTGGNGPDLDLKPRSAGVLLMTLKPYEPKIQPLNKLVIYPHPILKPTAHIKSLAYLDRLYVKQHALNCGAQDAIVRCADGYLMETAFSNLFWCRESQMMVPSGELNLYSGVALTAMKQAAKEVGLEVLEVNEKKIPNDAHVYTCNAMTGLVPIDYIQDSCYSRNSDLQDKLMATFRKLAWPRQ